MNMQGQISRALPQNLEAERGLLGAILRQNDAIFEASAIVVKSDFFEPYHGEIFILMRDQIDAGRSATPTTLMHDVSQDADIGGLTAGQYLAGLLRDAPPPILAVDLARTIRDLALRRRILAANAEIEEAVFSAPVSTTADEIRAKMEAIMSGLTATASELGIKHIGEVADRVLTRVDEAYKADRTLGIDVGLKGLQDLTGPLMPGRLYVIGGDAGSGKSALAQQIAENIAIRGTASLICQIEMTDEEMAERAMASRTGISAADIERAAVNAEQFEALAGAANELKSLPIYIDSLASPTAAMIRGRAIRMRKLYGIGCLIIDHLLYMGRPHAKANEIESVDTNLIGLKRIAKDLGIPVIVLDPFTSDFMREKNIRLPNVGDLYMSGYVHRHADVIALVHRAEYVLSARPPQADDPKRGEWAAKLEAARGKADFVLGKRRGGKGTGTRTVGFDAGRTRFTDRLPTMYDATAELPL